MDLRRMEPFVHDVLGWPCSYSDSFLQQGDSCSAIHDGLCVDAGDAYLQRMFQLEGSTRPVAAYCHVPLSSAAMVPPWNNQFHGAADGQLAFTSIPSADSYPVTSVVNTSCEMLTSAANLSYIESDNTCFWEIPNIEQDQCCSDVPVHYGNTSEMQAAPSPLNSLPSPLDPAWNLPDASNFREVCNFVPVQQDLRTSATMHGQLVSTETPKTAPIGGPLSLDAAECKMGETASSKPGGSNDVLILDGSLGLSAAKAAEITARLSSRRHQALNVHHCSLLIDSPLDEQGQSAEWGANRFDDCINCVPLRPLCQDIASGHGAPFGDFHVDANSPSLRTTDFYSGIEHAPSVGLGVGFCDGVGGQSGLDRFPNMLLHDQFQDGNKAELVPGSLPADLDVAPSCSLIPCSLELEFAHAFAHVPEARETVCSDPRGYWGMCTQHAQHNVHDAKPDSGASRTSSRMTMHLHHVSGSNEDVVWDTLESCMESTDKEVSGTLKHVTLDALQSVYDLPINEAAKKLGLGVTVLKKFCRKFDIPRWPYRKLKSLEKLENSLRSLLENSLKKGLMDDPSSAELASTLEKVQDYRQLILKDPSIDLEAEVKKWRQRNFKMEFKQRHTGL